MTPIAERVPVAEGAVLEEAAVEEHLVELPRDLRALRAGPDELHAAAVHVDQRAPHLPVPVGGDVVEEHRALQRDARQQITENWPVFGIAGIDRNRGSTGTDIGFFPCHWWPPAVLADSAPACSGRPFQFHSWPNYHEGCRNHEDLCFIGIHHCRGHFVSPRRASGQARLV
eukprot:gene493-biopygen3016